jgi:hypothetical protein
VKYVRHGGVVHDDGLAEIPVQEGEVLHIVPLEGGSGEEELPVRENAKRNGVTWHALVHFTSHHINAARIILIR